MNEEQTKSDVFVMKKDFENKLEALQKIVDDKDGQQEILRSEMQRNIDKLLRFYDEKSVEYTELEGKYEMLNDLVNKSKEFKQGSSEFDKMTTRIFKLEGEVDLYKKVLIKDEREHNKTVE